MPLNASERQSFAVSMLRCFNEDFNNCGRLLKFLQQFTVGNVNLLLDVQNAASTYQPFLDEGLSIQAWKDELARIYNSTFTG